MTIELRRMYQRRGLAENLPATPENGEFYVTLDTEEVYIGINGNLVKLMLPRDVVDNLISNSATLPLSANQGSVLKAKIDSVENFVMLYKQEIDNLIDENLSIVHRGDTPPMATNLIWDDEQ